MLLRKTVYAVRASTCAQSRETPRTRSGLFLDWHWPLISTKLQGVRRLQERDGPSMPGLLKLEIQSCHLKVLTCQACLRASLLLDRPVAYAFSLTG